jgi:hypothetical protein
MWLAAEKREQVEVEQEARTARHRRQRAALLLQARSQDDRS